MKLISLTVLLLSVAGPVFSEPFGKDIEQLLGRYCLDCHDAETQKGELDLERFTSIDDIAKDSGVWENVLRQIADGEMPPKKKPQFTAEEREQFTRWVQQTLDGIALANAGDPGPVVLRRLSNREYTYTIRDLTEVETLDPAREFPIDGAAGEGFTNVGSALVMSPALLTKYLDAAKEVANHAMILPDGIEFSPSISRSDWTQEKLAAIRELYTRYTTTGEGAQTVQQGVRLDMGVRSGRLPLGRYLDALQDRGSSDGLSEKYLRILREALESTKPSLLLDPLREKYRAKKLTTSEIEPWQNVLWRFASVGHIGKVNGPKAWQEPVSPIESNHEMRIKLSGDREVTLYLTTTDAGDGSENDDVIWENPRLVAPGKPDLPVNDFGALVEHLESHRAAIIATTEDCLNAIAQGSDGNVTVASSRRDSTPLSVWRKYLGFSKMELGPLLKEKVTSGQYNFIKGWKAAHDLSVLANSSDKTVQIPGIAKGHSIVTHPSPTIASVIAWRSPVSGKLRIEGNVADAHTACGNGIVWALELRRGFATEILASGEKRDQDPHQFGPFENVPIEPGQVLAFVVRPRDREHTCDLTAVNLTVTDGKTTWDLAKDVSPNILAGNPHGPWHFLGQPADTNPIPDAPAPIVEWCKKPSLELAAKVKNHLENDFPLSSPLLTAAMNSFRSKAEEKSLSAKAPSVLEIKIPAAFAKEREFVVTGKLASSNAGSVQMQVLTEKPDAAKSLVIGESSSSQKRGKWSDNNLVTQHSAPIIVNNGSESRKSFETAFDEFRSLFPIALCYTRIVPVDEVVTLTLRHREDEHLTRLMLDERETAELDRLWDEMRFVSRQPLQQLDAFNQLWQYATQDADPSAFEPMREPIRQDAAAFEKRLIEVEPKHVEAARKFTSKAWRRPLSENERVEFNMLYQTLREQELPHEAAIRQLLARVLVAPAFLYRGEAVAPGREPGPVSDWELATRLSYFLWSSVPDAQLRASAKVGELRNPDRLIVETKRMISDPKVRRLATEFGAQWLHVRDLETLDEKSERHFPTFAGLRDEMQEETVRFFIDLFQNDRSILSLLDADHSFVNRALAEHYDMEIISDKWQRIDGFRERGRGGILGFSATLAKHSGASRTSPILRGNWISEVLLGEKLPRPPKDVPVLPEEAPDGLTERQLIERHSSDPSCARCHARIDPLGFALEGFDAIGRARPGTDTRATLADGTQFDGIKGLRFYLVETRREDFVGQFCRKLLGYALGRAVQLSDKPLLDEILIRLEENEYRVHVATEMIVRSPQFRNVRGRNFPQIH